MGPNPAESVDSSLETGMLSISESLEDPNLEPLDPTDPFTHLLRKVALRLVGYYRARGNESEPSRGDGTNPPVSQVLDRLYKFPQQVVLERGVKLNIVIMI